MHVSIIIRFVCPAMFHGSESGNKCSCDSRYEEIVDSIRLRAAHLGLAVRPAEPCCETGTQEEPQSASPAAESPGIGEKSQSFTSTETLFLRVNQGQQGVLQLHKAPESCHNLARSYPVAFNICGPADRGRQQEAGWISIARSRGGGLGIAEAGRCISQLLHEIAPGLQF